MTLPRDMTDASDEAMLLARYSAGDAAAARLLMTQFLPLAYGYACRMLGGDRAEAEDVAQEAMLRLWRAAPGWRAGEAKVSTWLYRVTANLVTDRMRARSARKAKALLPLDEAPEMAGDGPDGEAWLIETQNQAALDQALDRALGALPERQREALVLRHIEGLSNPEIAAVMGTGVEAVESLTARAKRGLAALLKNQRESFGFDGEKE